MSERKGKLLVVDDNEMNRDVLSRRLLRRGYDVGCAEDGHRALEMVEAEHFDMVLLDIMMPGISGLEVLVKIREKHSHLELPVVMTTAESDSGMIVEALRLGANDYVTKPIDFPVIMARIETQLSMRVQQEGRPDAGYEHLSVGKQAKGKTATHLCGHCKTALYDTPAECTECKQEMPADGWIPIADSAYPFLGQTIGRRFVLERFIGKGAASSVYRAREMDLNRVFAAKIIDIEALGHADRHEQIRERIRLEVEAMARIQNPHVVKIYDVLLVRDSVFALIVDHVKGLTLGYILEQVGKLKPSLALAVIRQVAQGLYEAHQLGMIHRDIKPDNVMLEKLPAGGYFAHVLDFGIVHILDNPVETKEFCGTPLYSPPEQVLGGRDVDHRADIYSLGAMLFHVMSGVPPFVDNTVKDVLRHHIRSPIPSLEPYLDHPEDAKMLDPVIQRMMAKKPVDRYADLLEFIRSLDQVIPAVH